MWREDRETGILRLCTVALSSILILNLVALSIYGLNHAGRLPIAWASVAPVAALGFRGIDVWKRRRHERLMERLETEIAAPLGYVSKLKIRGMGTPLGEDDGILTFSNGLMRFDGIATTFAISSDNVTILQPTDESTVGAEVRFLIERIGKAVEVSLVALKSRPMSYDYQTGEFEGQVESWLAARPDPNWAEILPPMTISRPLRIEPWSPYGYPALLLLIAGCAAFAALRQPPSKTPVTNALLTVLATMNAAACVLLSQFLFRHLRPAYAAQQKFEAANWQ